MGNNATLECQQRMKGYRRIYATTDLHALLPFSWYSWRFNRIHQVAPVCSPNEHILPGLLILQYCIDIGSIANTFFSIAGVLQYF